MNKTKTISGNALSWIGIGSYGIGGRGHRDLELTEKKADEKYIDALEYQFEKGYNFSEISLGYGHGNSARLFAYAIKSSGFDRSNLFLTDSIYPRDVNSIDDVKNDIEKMYKVFHTDYFDSTLVTQSLFVKFGDKAIIKLLQNLLKSKRSRFVSLSNASVAFIKKFKKEFGDKVFAHETHLSFEVRLNQDYKVFDTCDKYGIENIIWRPLRRNKTSKHSWDLLIKLSEEYKRTQNQVILNWISHLGYKPMVMSCSKNHIRENWEARDFRMKDSDYNKINNFKVPNFDVPEIDWEKEGNGIGMADFSISFEDHYKNIAS